MGDLSLLLHEVTGIVAERADERLFARHEVYVRHIVQDVADIETVRRSLEAIIAYFANGSKPVAKNFVRKDHQLFRFSFNADLLIKFLKRRMNIIGDLFDKFRLPFQQDGHYWLHYGLFLRASHRQDEALVAFKNSIQAYPQNLFARHALAHQKLIIAKSRAKYDAKTERLVAEAVTELLAQNARDAEVDAYPLETLANNHCAILMKFGRTKEAQDAASRYYDMVVELERTSKETFTRLKARLLTLATTGEWR